MLRHIKIFLLALGLAWCPGGYADVMEMGLIMPEADSAPKRGMFMTEVEQVFGVPESKVPAVGEPPISRWVYGDYVVYFEGAVVLYAVQRKK
jgi:hypothetical protein